ncbi:MFS transporter [Helicobacter sp. 13S00401-1]|uniref:MFS transporter n=1 Tax=Helicobacter sp. 13S00401-1 TaxID=1905758 RepID=UPI000BA6BBDC|nr:MFS transporter [Helicobacter sp. 13S00401-1]PAF49294.1 MFS transporter [Helicobacter sp. 13S00401-1]
MQTTSLDSANKGYLKVILLLALSSFCMGVAEFIVAGILTPLGHRYHLSDDDIGYMSTIYAIGVVIGAPILGVLVSRFNYKFQLASTISIFGISNLAIFIFDNFAFSLVARFISGLMHGLFFVIATVIALKVSPKEKASFALSLMVGGLTLALVSGVPLGIYLSRFDLLFPFLFLAIVSFIVSGLILVFMPRITSKKHGLSSLFLAFKFKILSIGFLITAFTCGSQFVSYIYLRVYLEALNFSPKDIVNIFLIYGISAILGNLLGGKITDRFGSFKALMIILILQILSFSSLSYIFFLKPYLSILSIILLGFFGFASIAPLKMLSSFLAHRFTPDSISSTISLNEGSFNVGIALASFVGGLSSAYISVFSNGSLSALFSLLALGLLLIFVRKVYYGRA